MVRGLSMIDAIAVGPMNQGITPSIWYMTSWGVGTYLSGKVLWASLISLALVGFDFSIVWGIPLICWGAVVSHVGGRSRRRARGYEIGIRPSGRKRLRDGPSERSLTGPQR